MHTYQEPIHAFCKRIYRGELPEPLNQMDKYNWYNEDTCVSFKQSDKDGFMKYLTLLADGARREKQYEVDRKQA